MAKEFSIFFCNQTHFSRVNYTLLIGIESILKRFPQEWGGRGRSSIFSIIPRPLCEHAGVQQGDVSG